MVYFSALDQFKDSQPLEKICVIADVKVPT
jgi:hypothetical protein